MQNELRAFDIRTYEDHQGCLILELSGELDLAEAPRLSEQLLRTLNTCNGPVVVDLSRLDFIDSTGLNALIAGYHRAKQLGRPYAVAGLRRSAASLFKITALDSVIPIYDTASDACDNLAFRA
jgi:anti-sigma B factor antagonist